METWSLRPDFSAFPSVEGGPSVCELPGLLASKFSFQHLHPDLQSQNLWVWAQKLLFYQVSQVHADWRSIDVNHLLSIMFKLDLLPYLRNFWVCLWLLVSTATAFLPATAVSHPDVSSSVSTGLPVFTHVLFQSILDLVLHRNKPELYSASSSGVSYFKINSKHDLHVWRSSRSLLLACSWSSWLVFLGCVHTGPVLAH